LVSFAHFEFTQGIVEKSRQFAVASDIELWIEIVLSKLEVDEGFVGDLPEELHPGSAQTNVKGFFLRQTFYQSSGIALVVADPGLVQKGGLKIMSALIIDVEF
jgi:hypothetical protein